MTFETNTPRARTICLDADEVVSLEARPGQEVLGTRGHLWITQDGDPRDVFVQPGQRFVFDRRGVAVIHALQEDGAFVIAGAPARRTGSAARLGRLVATLRAWFRRPVAPRTVRGRLAQTPT